MIFVTNKTCTAAVFHGPGRPLELQEFEVPDLKSNEALVRVDLCTLCGSDLHTISGARRERIPDLTDEEMRDVVGYVDYVIRRRDRGGD